MTKGECKRSVAPRIRNAAPTPRGCIPIAAVDGHRGTNRDRCGSLLRLPQCLGDGGVIQRGHDAAQFGQAKADWMIRRSRNLCLYPNVYLMDQFSSQIRTYRPLAVDKTEVTIYCIAPKGESAVSRSQRIRQYEDFFNATGMATRTISRSSAPARRRTRPPPRRGTT